MLKSEQRVVLPEQYVPVMHIFRGTLFIQRPHAKVS